MTEFKGELPGYGCSSLFVPLPLCTLLLAPVCHNLEIGAEGVCSTVLIIVMFLSFIHTPVLLSFSGPPSFISMAIKQ